ncbi:hypothetical protein [Jatrophihabitans sp.]|uniref:hypothetical protein n=1 Tax=Jatrophihabitans sp. TaxID=1932789 RepID=UPI002C8A1F66|nr:hypothetical protein [Jatrophihabitans sp.]
MGARCYALDVRKYTIGTIQARVTWATYGGFTHSEMFFNPNLTVHNMVFTATMFNGSEHAPHGGSPIRHTFEKSETYSYVYPHRDLTWDYFNYNTTMYDHNLANRFNWSAPGYPGYFYLYIRSPIAHTNRLGDFTRYTFDLPADLAQNHAGWGYR